MNKPVCIWLGVEFSPEKWCQFPNFKLEPLLSYNKTGRLTLLLGSHHLGLGTAPPQKKTHAGRLHMFTAHVFFCNIFNLEMDEHRWWTMQLFQVSSNSYVNIKADSSTAKVPLPVAETHILLHDYLCVAAWHFSWHDWRSLNLSS